MPKPVLTLVLNRNLPQPTEAILDGLANFDSPYSDFAVIESGSSPDRQANAPTSFVADWPEAIENGLRYPRGFNFGLAQARKQQKHEFYFLVCNDVSFPQAPVIKPLLDEMLAHPRIGILSPSDPSWGEHQLVPENETKLSWYLNHMAWLVRGDFIDSLQPPSEGDYMNYLYDGTNFRGYLADIELLAKAYANDYAAALTRKVTFHEDRNLNTRLAATVKTEDEPTNLSRMEAEGLAWLRAKYGFNSRWNMTLYVETFYKEFLARNPDYQQLAI